MFDNNGKLSLKVNPAQDSKITDITIGSPSTGAPGLRVTESYVDGGGKDTITWHWSFPSFHRDVVSQDGI